MGKCHFDTNVLIAGGKRPWMMMMMMAKGEFWLCWPTYECFKEDTGGPVTAEWKAAKRQRGLLGSEQLAQLAVVESPYLEMLKICVEDGFSGEHGVDAGWWLDMMILKGFSEYWFYYLSYSSTHFSTNNLDSGMGFTANTRSLWDENTLGRK